jgi:hypothetical protein
VPQNRVRYQEGLSLSDFIQAYGTEEKCLAALELARWPEGFRCPQCGEGEKVGVINDDRRKDTSAISVASKRQQRQAQSLPLPSYLYPNGSKLFF